MNTNTHTDVSSTTASTPTIPYQLPISPLEQASNLQLNPLALNSFYDYFSKI